MSPDMVGLQHGVSRWAQKSRDHNHAWALARQAWDAGMPVHELSRLLGCERSTICRHAKRMGWPQRAPGRKVGPRGPLSLMCPNCGISVTVSTRPRRVA